MIMSKTAVSKPFSSRDEAMKAFNLLIKLNEKREFLEEARIDEENGLFFLLAEVK